MVWSENGFYGDFAFLFELRNVSLLLTSWCSSTVWQQQQQQQRRHHVKKNRPERDFHGSYSESEKPDGVAEHHTHTHTHTLSHTHYLSLSHTHTHFLQQKNHFSVFGRVRLGSDERYQSLSSMRYKRDSEIFYEFSFVEKSSFFVFESPQRFSKPVWYRETLAMIDFENWTCLR